MWRMGEDAQAKYMINVKDNGSHISNIKDYFKHPWRDTHLQPLIQLL